MGSRARNSSGRSAASLHSPKTQHITKRSRQGAQPPRTPLIDLDDALHSIGCTVDVITSALRSDDDPFIERAAMVLHEHVFEPLEKARAAIQEHAAYERHLSEQSPDGDPLVKPRQRRKNGAPNGSRDDKRRQRSRRKERRRAFEPREGA